MSCPPPPPHTLGASGDIMSPPPPPPPHTLGASGDIMSPPPHTLGASGDIMSSPSFPNTFGASGDIIFIPWVHLVISFPPPPPIPWMYLMLYSRRTWRRFWWVNNVYSISKATELPPVCHMQCQLIISISPGLCIWYC